MDEAKKRSWDVVLGIGGTLATVATILVGVQQFNEGEASRTRLEYTLLERKDLIETQRQLWVERLTAYRGVADIAGRLLADIDRPEEFAKARSEFARAYWGTMILVEDRAVETAMVDMKIELDRLSAGWSTRELIAARAKDLISACRKSVEKGPPRL